MFTNNWKKIIASTMMGDGTVPGVTMVDYLGKSTSLYCYLSKISGATGWHKYMGTVYTSLNGASPCVCFGDGTTSPTEDDYNLSGNIITTISTTVTRSRTNDEDGVIQSAVYTITNTGSESITISEIGMFGYWYTNSSNYTTYLLERTLLDTPVTIEPGGVGQVTYNIRMNLPTT